MPFLEHPQHASGDMGRSGEHISRVSKQTSMQSHALTPWSMCIHGVMPHD